MLVSDGAILLTACLATLEKKSIASCKSCYTLQSWAATCNGFKTIHAIFAESKTEFYFVKSLQAHKSYETSCKEDMLHAATYVQLVSQCCRAQFYFLQRLQRFF